MWQAGINVIAGIWAIVSSSTGSLITPGNFLITGLVVALFGFWNPQWQWQGIVDGILGQWLILSSVIPGQATASPGLPRIVMSCAMRRVGFNLNLTFAQ